jgi:hypothetical protein
LAFISAKPQPAFATVEKHRANIDIVDDDLKL